MKKYAVLTICCFIFIFSGCKTFEPEKHSSSPVSLPRQFSIKKSSGESVDKLPLFKGHTELKKLINEALKNNYDLKILKARIAKAEAAVKKKNAALLPDLRFSFGGKKQQVRAQKSHDSGGTSSNSHSWDSSLNSLYTPDVWGKKKAGIKAEQLDIEAVAKDLENSKLELKSTLTKIWIDIIASRNKRDILKSQIEKNRSLLKLQKLRFLNGKANALDVSQQAEALAKTNSLSPLLEKQEQVLLNNFVFLSGKTNADTIEIKTRQLPEFIPLPEVGIPIDILENRPDIKAAQLRLHSSRWDISAAKRDLLPTFNLTAQALFSSGRLDLLFYNWLTALSGSFTSSLFDGGLKKAEIERAKAAAEELLNVNAKTIAKAVQEVEDTLITIEKQSEYIKLLEIELESTRMALRDARIQYLNGQRSYLSYLVAWTGIESLERQLIGEQAEYLKLRVDLHNVLGLEFKL